MKENQLNLHNINIDLNTSMKFDKFIGIDFYWTFHERQPFYISSLFFLVPTLAFLLSLEDEFVKTQMKLNLVGTLFVSFMEVVETKNTTTTTTKLCPTRWSRLHEGSDSAIIVNHVMSQNIKM